MNFFLDTSVVIKLYHKETGSEELLAVLTSHASDLVLTIADITRIEFHSAFLRRARTHEISGEKANYAFMAFDQDMTMFNRISIDETAKSTAVTLLDHIAHRCGLRTLDAHQLSAALLCHQIFPVDFFVTADRRFLNIAKDYFIILNPEGI